MLASEGAVLQVVAPRGGPVTPTNGKANGKAPADGRNGGSRKPLLADKTYLTADSVQFDAVMAADSLEPDPGVAVIVQEAFRHHKPIAAWGDGRDALVACGIPTEAPGVVVGERANDEFGAALVEAMGWHRFWERIPTVLAARVGI